MYDSKACSLISRLAGLNSNPEAKGPSVLVHWMFPHHTNKGTELTLAANSRLEPSDRQILFAAVTGDRVGCWIAAKHIRVGFCACIKRA